MVTPGRALNHRVTGTSYSKAFRRVPVMDMAAMRAMLVTMAMAGLRRYTRVRTK